MKIIKGALFQHLENGRRTLQIGNLAVGPCDFEEHPDEWFVAANSDRVLQPLSKAESGDCLLYWSREGFMTNQKLIREAFESGVQRVRRTDPPYTWMDLVNHASEFWSMLEEKTVRKAARLKKQIAELEGRHA
jgi:hypothetical protein